VSCLGTNAKRPWQPRAGHGAIVLNEEIVVLAEYSGRRLNDIWCSDDMCQTWCVHKVMNASSHHLRI
jgi:hypothetical protein